MIRYDDATYIDCVQLIFCSMDNNWASSTMSPGQGNTYGCTHFIENVAPDAKEIAMNEVKFYLVRTYLGINGLNQVSCESQ